MLSRNTEPLKSQAAEAIRAYHDKGAPEHSHRLREAAECLVKLRERYLTDAGRPDWAGRTYAYRTAVSEIYSMSGVSKSELAPIAATVRYHIGNVLREQLSEEELEDAGLAAKSPRERAQVFRARQSSLVSLFSHNGEMDPDAPIEALRLIAAAAALLSKAEPEDVRGAEARDRRAAGVLLDEVAERAEALKEATRGRTKG